MCIRDRSGIHRLIIALEERGFIRRLPHRARALEVIRKVKKPSLISNLNKEKFVEIVSQAKLNQNESAQNIPLLGTIAAGAPIEAISDMSDQINVPPSKVSNGQHFALQVKGESMIEAGINHGDIVVIKEQKQANNGDIVVALIDNQEATLKRLYKKGELVELEAANKNYETQVYNSTKVTIQGRLVGLLRTY